MDYSRLSNLVKGSMTMVVANSRFKGTDLKEGALLSMIGWEKELTHKSNSKKKPTLVFLMSHLHKIPRFKRFVILFQALISGAHRGLVILISGGCRGYATGNRKSELIWKGAQSQ